jgi:hypothetical protein
MKGQITWKSELGDVVTAPVLRCYQRDKHFHVIYQGAGYEGRFALVATWAQQRTFDFFGYGFLDEVVATEGQVMGCLNQLDGCLVFKGDWFDPAADSGRWKLLIEINGVTLVVPGPVTREHIDAEPPAPLYLVEVSINGSMATYYVFNAPSDGHLWLTDHISRGLPDGNHYDDLDAQSEQLRLQQVLRSSLQLPLVDAMRVAKRAEAEYESPSAPRFMSVNVVHSDGTARAEDVRRRRRVANGE